MKEVINHVKRTCDVCGEEYALDTGVSEDFRYALTHLSFEVWYGGRFRIVDICGGCNREIMTLLFNANLLDHAQKER